MSKKKSKTDITLNSAAELLQLVIWELSVGLKTIDLHGMQHHEVENELENFLLTTGYPARVITGNSVVMIKFLEDICKKHKLHMEIENYYNLGSYIVRE